MNIEIMRAFFGWCTVINAALLLLAVLIPLDIPEATYQVELRTLSFSGELRSSIYDKIIHVG